MQNFNINNAPGIYIIYCLINNKIYIGSSYRIRTRLKEHFNALKKNKHNNMHLQNAYNKYGEDCFKCSVLEYCDKNLLIKREQFYLNDLKPYERKKGFNICPKAGSLTGLKKNIDSIKKQIFSQNLKKEEKRIRSPDGKIFVFKNTKEFARSQNIPYLGLCQVLNQEIQYTCGGWRLPDKEIPGYIFLNPQKQTVFVKKGELVQFCKKNNLNYNLMLCVAKKKRIAYKGWAHKDNEHLYVELTGPSQEKEYVCKKSFSWFWKEKKLSQSNFSNMLLRKIDSVKGWHLSDTIPRFKKEYHILSPDNQKIVIKYGQVKEAALKTGLSCGQVNRLIYGLQKTCNGYKSLHEKTRILK